MIFLLNRTLETTGILLNNSSESCWYWDDMHVQYLKNGASSYSFKTIANHKMTRDIAVGGYAAMQDLDGEFQLFHIMQIDETHDDLQFIEVYCENAGLELLNDITRPYAHGARNVQQALNIILQDTEWKIGRIDKDINEVVNLNWTGYKKVFDRLEELALNFNCELKFRVDYKNGKFLGRYVDVYEERGNRTYKRFEYGKDILSIKRTVDMTELATALIGVGESGLTFKNVSWSTSNGKPINKPLNQDFVADEIALETYNRNGNHVFDVFEYDTKDPNVLLEKTYKALQERKKPRIQYDMDLALLERLADIEHEAVRIGDTVYVIDNSFYESLTLQARVVELHTSYTDPSQDKCVLSNYTTVKRTSLQSVVSNTKDKVTAMEVTVKENTDAVKFLGTKMLLVQDTEPVLPEEDQVWCNTSVTPNTWKKWTGTEWVACIGLLFDALYGGLLVLGDKNNGGRLQVLNAEDEPEVDIGMKDEADNYVSGFKNIVAENILVTGNMQYDGIFIPNNRDGVLFVDETIEESNYTFFEALYPTGTTAATAAKRFSSLQQAVESIPKINNGLVTIVCLTNITAEYGAGTYFSVQGFSGTGEVWIDLNGKTAYGSFRIQDNSSSIVLISQVANKGTVKSSNGDVIQYARNQEVFIDNVHGYGTGSVSFIYVRGTTSLVMQNCSCKNVTNGIQCAYGSHVYAYGKFDGTVSTYAYFAYYGGTITANTDSNPTGGTLSYSNQNGRIWTKGTATAPPTTTDPSSPTNTYSSKTFSATSASQWRSNGGWGATGSNDSIQGAYGGYGPYIGKWFFDTSSLSSTQKQNVTKVRIYITRKSSGGSSGAGTAKIRCHTHSGTSGGTSFSGSTYTGSKFAWGEGKWVDITSIAKSVLSGAPANFGFGLDGLSSASYMRFSPSAKLEITYKN